MLGCTYCCTAQLPVATVDVLSPSMAQAAVNVTYNFDITEHVCKIISTKQYCPLQHSLGVSYYVIANCIHNDGQEAQLSQDSAMCYVEILSIAAQLHKESHFKKPTYITCYQ